MDSYSIRNEKMDVRVAFVITPSEKKYIEEAIDKARYRKASQFYREAVIEKAKSILEN